MRRAVLSAVAIILIILPGRGASQIQIGTIRGAVTDPAGAAVAGAEVSLSNPITGYSSAAVTDDQGRFAFNNVPFADYVLRTQSAGFQSLTQRVGVRSNIPVSLDIRLSLAGASESLSIEAAPSLVEKDSASTKTEIDESLIARTPGVSHSRLLQRLIAATPGFATENNGLLHVRGVDDGLLYVIDGIPTVDRLDAVSSSAFDADMIRSLTIITGNIPAEFGGRSGAVAIIQPGSGISTPFMSGVTAGAGSHRAGEINYALGAGIRDRYGLFVNASASRSDRFLDPVDLRNFNNRGGALKLNARSDWHPTSSDIFLFNFAANGTDFHVSNDLEQELAGQRQRQELRDNSQSVSWQRVWSKDTVSNLAYFRRYYQSELIGSNFDTPIFAHQERRHARQGIIASLTHQLGGHTMKAGFEGQRITPREFFTFAVTDREEAEEREVSDAALAFDKRNPFVFRDRRVGGQLSAYFQDAFSAFKNFTISAGVRFDRSSLPVTDHQLSPRVGAVYYIPATRTAIRASFNRLYMPPQVENLLLADSEQARQLSPFQADGSRGGAPISPEKVSAYEAGFSQDVLGLLKLDAAYWHRSFRNFDDPNVFFNTTIIFPNSVARGTARGIDARVNVVERAGWSGYLSYTNARILQTGPINGGLFLTDEFVEIGPGTRFVPDHDQRNVAAFAVIYNSKRAGFWASLSGRHESGVPLEVEQERLEELQSAPGSDLVNFGRARVKPWTVFDISTGIDLFNRERVSAALQFDIQNVANKSFAYNFGSPFEGTHFGHPRLWAGRIKVSFH
jgi:hypothetical protein